MSSRAVASASTSAQHSRDSGSNKFRVSIVLCVLEAHCDDAQQAQLLVQQRLIAEQGRSESHENTNNPAKGHGLENKKFDNSTLCWLNMGSSATQRRSRGRLAVDPTAPANAKSSKSTRAASLWTSVPKPSCRVQCVLAYFEKGALLLRFQKSML
jgi:hypothetical protein